MEHIITKIITDFDELDIIPKTNDFCDWLDNYLIPLDESGKIKHDLKTQMTLTEKFKKTRCNKSDFESIFQMKVDSYIEVTKINHDISAPKIKEIAIKLNPYIIEFTLSETVEALRCLYRFHNTKDWGCTALLHQLNIISFDRFNKLQAHLIVIDKLAS